MVSHRLVSIFASLTLALSASTGCLSTSATTSVHGPRPTLSLDLEDGPPPQAQSWPQSHRRATAVTPAEGDELRELRPCRRCAPKRQRAKRRHAPR